jgi:hypothetical protein
LLNLDTISVYLEGMKTSRNSSVRTAGLLQSGIRTQSCLNAKQKCYSPEHHAVSHIVLFHSNVGNEICHSHDIKNGSSGI